MSNFRAIPFSKTNANNSVDTLEPIIRSILIKNSNTVDGINISNNNSLPLTPPDYTTLFEKRSVSFNIPEDNKNFHNNKSFIEYDDDVEMSIEDGGDNSSDEYDSLAENFNSIDISAKLLNNSDEIRVSLLERDTEMKELFIINKDYFDGVKQFISDNNGATCNTWQEFLNLLYSKREEISDKKWMKCIESYLKENPLFLNNNFIDVTLIRDFPKILENFESSYPQFFVNLKQTLDKKSTNNSNNVEQEEKTPYEEFKNILLKSRNEMTDIEWEESIYNILNPYPRLIEQFEEIIAYEISEE
ncbi:6192_t:CDS:2 [Entrophospora sp. SA101]|nr:4590_t:CDS:2 [Entrophospora sp. SA101]CAJ0897675.1 6192_t:CDS:2 [Entrophospora sp. SA101]